MAAELGETSDPKELIPGNTGDLDKVAGSLTKYSGAFEDVSNGLVSIRIYGWTGKAEDAFREEFDQESPQWLYACDAMSDAAKVINGYAGVLSAAQQQAAEAIALWETGNEGAQERLETARQQVQHEAESVAKKLAELAGAGSSPPPWLGKAADLAKNPPPSTPTAQVPSKDHKYDSRKDKDGNNWKDPNHNKKFGGDAEAAKDPKVSMQLASVSGEADVWDAGANGTTVLGDSVLSGSADVKALGVSGSAGLSVNNTGLKAEASGMAYLAKADAAGSFTYGIVGAQGATSAAVDADASVNASVGKDGLHAGGEAFAGAKVQGNAHADVGGVGVGGTAEGWAGAGAEAHADAGMKDGKFVIGADIGVGLGLGGKIGGQIEVDPGKVVSTVSNAADAVGDALKSLNPFG